VREGVKRLYEWLEENSTARKPANAPRRVIERELVLG
jgi:hypothetical protein